MSCGVLNKDFCIMDSILRLFATFLTLLCNDGSAEMFQDDLTMKLDET